MYGTVKCLPTVAQEVEQLERAEPGVVVGHQRPGRTVEVEEALELGPDRGGVGDDHLAGQQVALGRGARRVADHPRAAADERHRPAAVALEMEQPEDRHEVADVERRPGRIEADVAGDRPRIAQPGGQARAWRRGTGRARRARRAARWPGLRRDRAASQAAAPGRHEAVGREKPVHIRPYAIVTDRMQTSLARRQRHRRNGSARGSGGGRAASSAAIALPLFLFGTLALLAIVGLRIGGRRLLLLQPGPARSAAPAEQPDLQPGDRRLRPDRQDRAGPLRGDQAHGDPLLGRCRRP